MRFSGMTWNIENLFPPGILQGSAKKITSSEYRAKCDYLSEVLLREQPDVVAFQELGFRKNQSIDDLQGRLEDLYPYTVWSKYPDSRGIYVGFLSRTTILSNPDDREGKHLVRMGRGARRIDLEPVEGLRESFSWLPRAAAPITSVSPPAVRPVSCTGNRTPDPSGRYPRSRWRST